MEPGPSRGTSSSAVVGGSNTLAGSANRPPSRISPLATSPSSRVPSSILVWPVPSCSLQQRNCPQGFAGFLQVVSRRSVRLQLQLVGDRYNWRLRGTVYLLRKEFQKLPSLMRTPLYNCNVRESKNIFLLILLYYRNNPG